MHQLIISMQKVCLLNTIIFTVTETQLHFFYKYYTIYKYHRICVSDDTKFHAQIPAKISHCESQRYIETPIQHVQDLRVP